MPCSPLSFSMRPVQIPCRFFRQVIDSAYLCRTRIDNSKRLCCLFIDIYYIFVILSEGRPPWRTTAVEGPAVPFRVTNLRVLAEALNLLGPVLAPLHRR